MKKGKANTVLLIVVILLGVLSIGGIIAYGYVRDTQVEKIFNPQKRKLASKIYESMMSPDLSVQYPETPEALVDYYNLGMKLIYGNMMQSDEKVGELLERMRTVYAEELSTMNDFDTQYAGLLSSLKNLKQTNTYVIDLERISTIYEPTTKNRCTVHVKQYTNNLGNIEIDYALEKDWEGFWRIAGWTSTPAQSAITDQQQSK